MPLDCPISCTGRRPRRRTWWSIYASGDLAAIKALQPFFAAFTRAVHDPAHSAKAAHEACGEPAGRHQQRVATAEAMVLGITRDPHQIVDLKQRRRWHVPGVRAARSLMVDRSMRTPR
jgi:hypothetical protein